MASSRRAGASLSYYRYHRPVVRIENIRRPATSHPAGDRTLPALRRVSLIHGTRRAYQCARYKTHRDHAGDLATARRYFLDAMRERPFDLKTAMRFARTSTLRARALWEPHARDPRERRASIIGSGATKLADNRVAEITHAHANSQSDGAASRLG